MSDESKTEEATEKHLREAVEEGRFAKAPDLQMVAVLAASGMMLSYSSRNAVEKIADLSIGLLGHLGRYQIQPEAFPEWAAVSAKTILNMCLPMGLACAGAGVLVGGLQTRFRLSPKAIGFKFDRLNPAAGFGRTFSKDAYVKGATDLLKLMLMATVLWSALRSILHDPIFYTPVGIDRLAGFLQSTASTLMNRSLMILGALGGLNYVYQVRKNQSDLKMTKEEVKEEHKQTDGNPKVKAHMRAVARRMVQKQMLAAVSTADVIITNPTHFAVALKYERGMDKAPMLLAKGEGAFAKRIKALGAEHEVPMVENKPVARMLFKHGKVGKAIPLELYQAVADILAFVYRTHRYYFHQLKQRRQAL